MTLKLSVLRKVSSVKNRKLWLSRPTQWISRKKKVSILSSQKWKTSLQLTNFQVFLSLSALSKPMENLTVWWFTRKDSTSRNIWKIRSKSPPTRNNSPRKSKKKSHRSKIKNTDNFCFKYFLKSSKQIYTNTNILKIKTTELYKN